MLWPDHGQSEALGHLRRALARLRKTLGAAHFEANRKGMRLVIGVLGGDEDQGWWMVDGCWAMFGGRTPPVTDRLGAIRCDLLTSHQPPATSIHPLATSNQ